MARAASSARGRSHIDSLRQREQLDDLDGMHPHDPSDHELLERWRGGDPRAGSHLLDRHAAALTRFFRTRLGEGGEDLVQDTLLACIEAAPRYRGQGSVRAFLLGIARKKLLMHLREQRHHACDPLDDVPLVARGPAPDRIDEQRELRQLSDALRELPSAHRAVLDLYYWEHLDVATIAERLDVAPGTIKSRLARARSELRGRLDAC